METGVILDQRTDAEKAKDYQADELASFAPVNWAEKKPNDYRKFSIRDQDGSLTCVAQATAKILGVENFLEEDSFIDFSARDIYERRANKPSGGMWLQDALSIASKYGTTTEARLPSQKMGESKIEAPFTRTQEDLDIAKKYRAGGYVTLPVDIEKIASVIATGKAVLLFFYFKYDEWDNYPQILDANLDLHGISTVRHGVAGTDFCLHKGKKCIVIDDSWGKFYGLEGQRIITEEFLNKRCYGAGYLLDLSNAPIQDKKPVWSRTAPLSYGLRNNADVRVLQDILKYEGLFPTSVPSTGNYLQVTAKAVYNWQVKHEVAGMPELRRLAGRRVGEKTLAKLRELYK